jgi:hypothetical protein
MATKKTETTEPKPARILSDGAIIGRALTKLQALDAAEENELAQSPATIRQKYNKRRDDLLLGLVPSVRAAVVAANKASRGEAAAE